MSAEELWTEHLKLVPHSPKHLRALIESAEAYARSIGYPPAEGLREFFVSKDVSPEFLAALQTATFDDLWTHGFALVHPAKGTVIGSAGFKGPPSAEGVVEIAYGIVAGHQGKGYATEAAQALVKYAFGSGLVRLVRAHTLPQANASTRVLSKCGFTHIGEVVDPEDGLVWRWEKTNT